MKKIIIITVAVFLFVGGLVAWALNQDSKYAEYKVEKNIENLGPIGQVFEEQSRTHIKVGEVHEAYNTPILQPQVRIGQIRHAGECMRSLLSTNKQFIT